MRIGQLLALVVAGMFLTKASAAEETKVEPPTAVLKKQKQKAAAEKGDATP